MAVYPPYPYYKGAHLGSLSRVAFDSYRTSPNNRNLTSHPSQGVCSYRVYIL